MRPEFVGEHSVLNGSLDKRMTDFISHIIGQRQAARDGAYDLRIRAKIGVIMEFGMEASIEFPDARSVRLECGNKLVECIGGYLGDGEMEKRYMHGFSDETLSDRAKRYQHLAKLCYDRYLVEINDFHCDEAMMWQDNAEMYYLKARICVAQLLNKENKHGQ